MTQTPLHTTILDFWRMVYDHHVQTIVMMENFGDEANNQGEYWPSDSIKQWEPFFVETTAAYQQVRGLHTGHQAKNSPYTRPTPLLQLLETRGYT